MATRRQVDPTQTTTLRARAVRSIRRRWNAHAKDVRVSIVDNDVFGALALDSFQAAEAAPERAFAGFSTTTAKVDAFMEWLRAEQDAGILELKSVPGQFGQNPWSNLYIQDSYKKGIHYSKRRLKKQLRPFKLRNSFINSYLDETIDTAFNHPVHADRVAAAYTRTFDGLKTITDVTNARIRRQLDEDLRVHLARAVIDGRGPKASLREFAKNYKESMEKVGQRRGIILMRTEIIAAHHSGNVGEMRLVDSILEEEGLAVQAVVKAEFVTADDERVCPDCDSLSGQVFTLDEIEILIPVHAQCRCVASPMIVEREGAGPVGNQRRKRIWARALSTQRAA